MKSKDLCENKACPNHGKYARYCGHYQGYLSQPKPIKKLSIERQKVKRKVYIPLVKEMLAQHPDCKVKSPVCVGKAQGLHHIEGREGDNLADKKKVIPCCNPCNSFIEANDAWARANGLKESKHKNYKRAS